MRTRLTTDITMLHVQGKGRFKAEWYGPEGHCLFPGKSICMGVVAHDLKGGDDSPLTLEFGQLVNVRGAGDVCFAVLLAGKNWGSTSARVAVLAEVPDTLLRALASTYDDPAVVDAAARQLRFTIVPLKEVVYKEREYTPEHTLMAVHAAMILVRMHVPASLCMALTSRECGPVPCRRATLTCGQPTVRCLRA